MKRLTVLLSVCLVSSAALAFSVMATLINQYMATSVTGQSIKVCVYQYGNSTFEKYFPMFASCPLTIQVQ